MCPGRKRGGERVDLWKRNLTNITSVRQSRSTPTVTCHIDNEYPENVAIIMVMNEYFTSVIFLPPQTKKLHVVMIKIIIK